jgi:DNA-binding GntR family transcriptional regulator
MPSFRKIVHESSDQVTSATGRVYGVLKQEILTCELAPGTPVYEGDIAERLEVSKTPVREALGMLVHEGLVEVRPRQGYRVTDVTLADVQEVFHMRLLLEPAAAELAAERATAEQLQELRSLVEADEGASYQDRVRQAARFHTTLAEASGNSRLAGTLRNLLEEMQRLFYMGLDIEDSISVHATEHRELVDALLKGNHHLSGEIARRQVETSRMRVFEAILASLTGPGNGAAADQVKLRPVNR